MAAMEVMLALVKAVWIVIVVPNVLIIAMVVMLLLIVIQCMAVEAVIVVPNVQDVQAVTVVINVQIVKLVIHNVTQIISALLHIYTHLQPDMCYHLYHYINNIQLSIHYI